MTDKMKILAEKTKKFCEMLAIEMGEDPEIMIKIGDNEVPLWQKYLPMATDHFLNDAYARVRQKFWDEEEAAKVRLLTEQSK